MIQYNIGDKVNWNGHTLTKTENAIPMPTKEAPSLIRGELWVDEEGKEYVRQDTPHDDEFVRVGLMPDEVLPKQ